MTHRNLADKRALKGVLFCKYSLCQQAVLGDWVDRQVFSGVSVTQQAELLPFHPGHSQMDVAADLTPSTVYYSLVWLNTRLL